MLGFGGGCHWCTEAVFQALAGVLKVRQGFIRSEPPFDTWSEAVEVDFDPARISVADLIGVHLSTHASTSAHKMRGKYRSAVYAGTPEQRAECDGALAHLREVVGVPFVTRVLPHRGFKTSDARFHDYYRANPEKPFCQAYIEPKMAVLRERHRQLLRPEQAQP